MNKITIPANMTAADPEKAARVTGEQTRLMELFAGADENKLDFISVHVQQLAWLAVTILDLQQQIDADGAVLPFQNGKNQSGLQANPACKLLIDCQKLYNSGFRALLPLVVEKPQRDGLKEFLDQFDCE